MPRPPKTIQPMALLASAPGPEPRISGKAPRTVDSIVIITGLSRVYLGVHSPMQVFVGWLVGLALLAATLALWPKLEAHIAKSANRQRGDMLKEERDGAARVRTAPTPFRPTAYGQIRGKVFGGSASSAEPHVKAVVPHFRARIARHIAWARKSGAARDSARFAAHLEERVGKFHVRTWVP